MQKKIKNHSSGIAFEILKYAFIVTIISSVVMSIIIGIVYIHFSHDLPSIIKKEDYKPMTVTQVLGKGNIVVGEYFEEKRYLIPFEDIPEIVKRAFIAAEDDRFFEHQGIDLQSIARAAIANFKAGRVVQGGSTITQQVAKSLLLTPERSFFRKIREAILAYQMENNLEKSDILYLYLNQIYLGQGAYGVKAAAQIYFNKDVKQLTIAEAAILGGLPQAPSKYSPLAHPKKAKERQLYVLRRLAEDHYISFSEMEAAAKEPLKIYFTQDLNEQYSPYYLEQIRKYLLEKYGKDNLYGGGYVIKTSLDANLSQVATKSLQSGLRDIDKKQGYRGPIRKNKTQNELQEAIDEISSYNLAKKYPFSILTADGSFAKDTSLLIDSGKSILESFELNELYQGVVSDIDEKRKVATVNLGLFKASLPLEKMKWARPVKEPSSQWVEPISKISDALELGDMIWVKLESKSEKPLLPVVSLEQIPKLQGALLSMDVKTGAVLSLVGGYDFKQSEFNRAIQAERQAGSTYKPIIYAAALEKGYTPSTIIQDSPIVFNAGENEKWKPENYEEKFYGDTTFRSSLVRSRNIPTIKIVQDIEVPYLINYSKRIGITNHLNPDLSIALGSSTVSLLDMVKVYSVFPRAGRKVKPVFIEKVIDREGKILEDNSVAAHPFDMPTTLASVPSPVSVAGELQVEVQKNGGKDLRENGMYIANPNDEDQVMDPRVAYVMTHLMNEVATLGTGAEAKNLGRMAAGKTGTTSDCLDAWFMGFTANVVTGVWVGFDTQKSIGPRATGAQVALPIWLEYMKEAVKSYPDENFAVPPGINFVFIDTNTGKLTKANKPNASREAFIAGTEPGSESSALRSYSGTISGTSNSDTPDNRVIKPSGQDLPTEEFFKEDIQ